jgi:hypothetical protein
MDLVVLAIHNLMVVHILKVVRMLMVVHMLKVVHKLMVTHMLMVDHMLKVGRTSIAVRNLAIAYIALLVDHSQIVLRQVLRPVGNLLKLVTIAYQVVVDNRNQINLGVATIQAIVEVATVQALLVVIDGYIAIKIHSFIGHDSSCNH